MHFCGAKLQFFQEKTLTLQQKYYEMKYLLTMICLLAAFSSCGSDHDDEPDVTPKGRTVLMYVSAENTLNDFFDTNLTRMVKGARNLSKGDHLIAFVDRARTTGICNRHHGI